MLILIFIQMELLFLSLAPVILILLYVNYRDKYEKEPLGLLLKALAAGAIITIPVIIKGIYSCTCTCNIWHGNGLLFWFGQV
ncbi:MAG: hypothetical protein B6I20_06160 [Bacteroidetes bacterium 4572_117]|nr:MAG: hypothetical protein B6I20_06160 [Bacteroidetes bacterium 4572_117]